MYKNRNDLSPTCSSSEELIAYLYGEMSTTEQSAFELHLSECDVCTAEFAELSLARLGVYEWHRDEFAELATPRIVVPYDEGVKRSWVDYVRAFFTSPVFATAGGAFAVVAIAAGVWLMSPKLEDIATAGDVTPASSPLATSIRRDQAVPAKLPETGNDASQSQSKVKETTTGRDTPAVKPATSRNPKAANPRTVKGEKQAPQPLQTRRTTAPPRLNDFEDEEDDTLRLGDLLAEVDTR